MKHIIKKLGIFALMVTLVSAIGCSKKDEGIADTSKTNQASEASENVSVTFMDGDTVLKTETVTSGGTVAEYTPTKDGGNFLGWFATPSMNRPFDFSAPITSDTSIFAGFSVFAEDTRDWFIVGNGKAPLLLESSWGAVITDAHKLTKAVGKNEYTITLDIQEGDEFQFAIDSSWHNKRGFGYVVDPGENFVANGGGLSANVKGMNITCAKSGNYTLTLTTYPADDVYLTDDPAYKEEDKEAFNEGAYDTITWVRNGDAAAIGDILTKFYIKGEKVTGWADVYDATTEMVKDGAKHTLTVKLEEGDQFLFTSMVDVGGTQSVGSVYVKYGNLDEAGKAMFSSSDGTDDGNIVVGEGATYTFIFDEDSGVLSASK